MLSKLKEMAKWVGDEKANRRLTVRAYSDSSWVCWVNESGFDVVQSRGVAGAGLSIKDAVNNCYKQFLNMTRKERSNDV